MTDAALRPRDYHDLRRQKDKSCNMSSSGVPLSSSSSSFSRKGSINHFEYENGSGNPPWKKLLYLKQPYPDNYTDSSFLSQLKRNTTVAKYSYLKVVDDFSLIVFYVSCILIVNLMFIGIYIENWDPVAPTVSSTMLLISSFVSLKYSGLTIPHSRSSLNVKSFVIISFLLLIASPILKSLTRSTSSDSIWAISLMLCIGNTMFYEYSVAQVYKPILSTNISLSNAIVLASRLESTMEVFLFILFAIQVNILLPLLDTSLRSVKRLKIFHYILMFVMFCLVNIWIWKLLNYKFLIYWLVSVLVIMVLMPAYFLSLQRFKNELQGPWDIAKPKFSRDAQKGKID